VADGVDSLFADQAQPAGVGSGGENRASRVGVRDAAKHLGPELKEELGEPDSRGVDLRSELVAERGGKGRTGAGGSNRHHDRARSPDRREGEIALGRVAGTADENPSAAGVCNHLPVDFGGCGRDRQAHSLKVGRTIRLQDPLELRTVCFRNHQRGRVDSSNLGSRFLKEGRSPSSDRAEPHDKNPLSPDSQLDGKG